MEHDEDTFGFKTAAKDKPLTHRGLLSFLSSVYDLFGLAAPFILEGHLIIIIIVIIIIIIIIKFKKKKKVLGMNQ